MKRIVILLLISIVFYVSKGQQTSNDTPTKALADTPSPINQQPNLELIKALADTLTSINQKLSLRLAKADESILILEQRIAQANDTISNQSSLLGGFGVLYTIITIIVALVAIATPIITYFFGIRPANKLLENFEAKVDRRLEDYLKSKREREVDAAIKMLRSDSQDVRHNAAVFLSLNQEAGFNDKQIFEIIQFLQTAQFGHLKDKVSYLLTSQESYHTTHYFAQVLEAPQGTTQLYCALRYFVLVGINKHIDVFLNRFKKAEHKSHSFINLIQTLNSISFEAVEMLFDSDELGPVFSPADIEHIRDSIHSAINRDRDLPKLSNTKLYKRIWVED